MTALPPIEELVPHRGRMLLLDELVAFDGQRALCRVRLQRDSTFVEGGAVDAVIALEYMAQAVAAFAGMRGRAAGRPPRIGFLLGTRELVLSVDRFAVGDELMVEVAHVWGEDQLGVFDCTVSRGGEKVASAALNVYQGPIEERTS
ncbi:ApeP family dehydratase [Anaeromyxobacter oryzisoli]|uniref:ApeP family dehydratase n=1 Tax=Anaeromyxobacter oryzisoli TaxID=2925408 RepID=UPI001F5A19DD|nr:3-hydroxylacyl-ACP dehydratase [Anaeromyxobacter sp. SG63]